MSKQEEIKQALAAATPGPWEVVNLGSINIAKGYRHDEGKHVAQWIAEMDVQEESEVEQAEADAELIANAPEYIDWLLKLEQSLQEDIMVLKDMVHTRNLENERLRKETIVKENSKETLTKQITDEVSISAAAIVERDRLRKELEEERKQAAGIRKAMQDVLYYLQRDSFIPAQDILEQYLAMGQEGEGNQRTVEVTLHNEGYKPHQINWDNVD